MKTKLLATSLLVSCALHSFAQVQENEPTKSYKNDIGFNTTFLLQGIFNASSTPFSFMYKKYKSDNKAIRLGFSINMNLDQNDPNGRSLSNDYTNSSFTNASLVVGKEFQRMISNKWTWYYGADLIPSYLYNDYQNFYNGIQTSNSKYLSVGLGLRPFLGIRYNINSRLYVSAEASLMSRYAYQTQQYNTNYNNEPMVIRDSKGMNTSLSSSPASGLFLFYRF